MNEAFLYTGDCIHGSMAQCTCACPVNLDIRTFIKKVRNGNFSGAYRTLANSVLFPAVVTELCSGCCTASCAENIDIPKIEQACVSFARSHEPNCYVLPAKEGKIAVIGAGLSGLACTLQLAAKKYDVTLYERGNQIGGTLKGSIDEKIYMDEFALQFKYAPYKLVLNQAVSSLDDLDGFDAIYIASGAKANDFGLLTEWNNVSMATARNGVFLGGEMTGADKMHALAHGIVAAASLERYLKVKSMSGQPENFIKEECLYLVEKNEEAERVLPANGRYFTREDAKAEASRCIMCDCSLCKDSCEFMVWMNKFPQDIETFAQSARNSMQGMGELTSSRMIFSCHVCGHCGSVCPKGVSLEKLFIDSKKILFDDKVFPEALHDYYMRDMDNALQENYLSKAAPGHETAGYMLFPGCRITGSGPQYVTEAYQYMCGLFPDTALMLGCCGVPALWAGNHALLNNTIEMLREDWAELGRPVAVIMCPTCIKTFHQYMPEMKCISIYEFIAKNGMPEGMSAIEGDWAVFDPCASREFPEMQQAVHDLAINSAEHVTVLSGGREQPHCCGMGGHIYPANKEVAINTIMHSAGLAEQPYITYCVNCRNLFLAVGKHCRHILDDLFGLEPLRKNCHIKQIKENRKRLKRELLMNVWNEIDRNTAETDRPRLLFTEELLDKMDRQLISEDDVEKVICYCEKTGETLYKKDTGTFVGYLQIGIITYWVEYMPEEDLLNSAVCAYRVMNAYSHRVMIGD